MQEREKLFVSCPDTHYLSFRKLRRQRDTMEINGSSINVDIHDAAVLLVEKTGDRGLACVVCVTQ
jgi:hypothetical protein